MTIDNIDVLIATRDLIEGAFKEQGIKTAVFVAVYPAKNLPDEFVLVKSLYQNDEGNVLIKGYAEICIYVKNLNDSKAQDTTQPNLNALNRITKQITGIVMDAEKNGVFFNEMKTTLVNDSDIRYFYNSVVVKTVSINI